MRKETHGAFSVPCVFQEFVMKGRVALKIRPNSMLLSNKKQTAARVGLCLYTTLRSALSQKQAVNALWKLNIIIVIT